MPSANELVAKENLNKVKSFDLDYYMCQECSLFQLTKFVSNKELFDNYLYMTGANEALLNHFKVMAHKLSLLNKNHDNRKAYVIGSNDGSEIAILEKEGYTTIGVEPSNLAKVANNRNLFTIKNFFTFKLSKYLANRYGKADLISANNVFAHIPNPKDMLLGMKTLLKDDGIISIEVHWLKSIVDNLEIETLYAEHYFVWSVTAMQVLTNQLGLVIADVIELPEQHGGSLRFIIKKNGRSSQRVSELKNKEKTDINVNMLKLSLQKRADERRNNIRDMFQFFSNFKIGIWSVPAKVPTLLNFCGITSKEVYCAYEIAPTKIGKYIPKANIPIKSESEISIDMPDCLIIGAWNYEAVALKKLDWYLRAGKILINPLTLDIYYYPQLEKVNFKLIAK